MDVNLKKDSITGYKHFYFSKYSESYKQIFHSIKYELNVHLLNKLSDHFIESISDKRFFDYDYYIKVPYHYSRLRQRGFNVLDKLFLFLETTYQIQHLPIITRKKATAKLALESKDSRQLLLNNAFELNNLPFKPNAKILLVDDIVTTQATMKSILYKLETLSGIKSIDCMSIIRV